LLYIRHIEIFLKLTLCMKILMMTDYFYPHIGGVEKVVFDLSSRLVAHGHEVMVLTFNIPQTKEEEIFHGIKIVRLNAFDFSKVFGFQILLIFLVN